MKGSRLWRQIGFSIAKPEDPSYEPLIRLEKKCRAKRTVGQGPIPVFTGSAELQKPLRSPSDTLEGTQKGAEGGGWQEGLSKGGRGVGVDGKRTTSPPLRQWTARLGTGIAKAPRFISICPFSPALIAQWLGPGCWKGMGWRVGGGGRQGEAVRGSGMESERRRLSHLSYLCGS